MSYLTMFDAVTATNIPSSARYAAGYVDGMYANVGAIKAHCPHAEVMSITVRGGIADCCDCESGDMTPAQAEAWVASRLNAGAYRPCVYASQSTFDGGLASALAKYGTKIRRWVAAYPGTGANVPSGYDAHQYSDGDIDTSVCLTNFFDGPPKPTVLDQWSAQVQIVVPQGSTGTVRAHVSVPLDGKDKGEWSIGGLPGIVKWSAPGGGAWRIKGMPFNSPPLGK